MTMFVQRIAVSASALPILAKPNSVTSPVKFLPIGTRGFLVRSACDFPIQNGVDLEFFVDLWLSLGWNAYLIRGIEKRILTTSYPRSWPRTSLR